ncbi:flagellar motor switch protein FliM [Sulfitobacter sp. JB4-11]|uniref:flagellar motor switch protein FliM n=1 Tax=Sulfitobacter rhodophyticola TaxID=3238304 RepID=UPI0035148065
MNKRLSAQSINLENVSLIDEIIRLSDFTFDRLPMLDIIGERLVANLSVMLPDMTYAVCEASFQQLDYLPMAQVIEGLPSPAVLAVATGHPFEGEILLVIDRPLVVTSMELMLGGKANQLTIEEADEFTSIELRFGQRLAEAALFELQRSLSVVGSAELELDRVETDPDAASVANSNSLCARMRFSVAIAGQACAFEVVIPYDALEPIRPHLGKIYFGDRSEGSNGWKDLLTDQIEMAHMDLEVVLNEIEVPIQTIMGWSAGDIVDLCIEEGADATVMGAYKPMFKAALGKRTNGYVAIQITEKLQDLEVGEDADNTD